MAVEKNMEKESRSWQSLVTARVKDVPTDPDGEMGGGDGLECSGDNSRRVNTKRNCATSSHQGTCLVMGSLGIAYGTGIQQAWWQGP